MFNAHHCSIICDPDQQDSAITIEHSSYRNGYSFAYDLVDGLGVVVPRIAALNSSAQSRPEQSSP